MTVIVKYREDGEIKKSECSYGNAKPAVSGTRSAGSSVSFKPKDEEKRKMLDKEDIINIMSDKSGYKLGVKIFSDGSSMAYGQSMQYNNGEYICGGETFGKFYCIRERRK